MLPKPAGCKGCPLYGNGLGFVPDEVVPGAKTFILLQAPGATEERLGKPACGPAGELLNNKLLPLAGLERGRNVSVGNVLKCRDMGAAGRTDSLPTGSKLDAAVRQCTSTHLNIPVGVVQVIAAGALAASHAAGGQIDIGDWRGFALRRPAIGLPTYVVTHPAALLHDPKMWWVNELDWRKAARFIAGTWPMPVPPYIEITDANTQSLRHDLVEQGPEAYVCIDTEYGGRKGPAEPGFLQILGIGICGRRGVTGYSVEWRALSQAAKRGVALWVQGLCERVPVVFQNFAADMPILKRFCGVGYNDYREIDDTMLAHAVLHAELPHTLRFLSSLYSPYGEHKSLVSSRPVDYNWGDVCATIALKEALWKEFASDPGAFRVYSQQSKPLIRPVLRSMEHGIRLDRSATVQRYGTLLHAAGQAEAEAQAYLGYPINLGSDDQVAHYLYHQRGYPVQRHPRTKQPTVANDALANLAQLLGGAGDTDSGQPEGTDPILMQRLAYQDAQHLIDSYIYGLLEGVHGETDASIQRLVRARAAAKGIGVNDLVEVVYPTFNIHSQKNARWSTTDPPLAQLPEQLRGILIPQPGHLIVSWDWKGIELRILQAESHSKLLERVHNDGVDLHTWTCCEMFGWAHPPNLADPNHAPENAAWRVQYNWQGAGDKRRVFAKSARYEMNYGGVGATAARRGVQLGLNASEVQKALSRLLTADRDYFLWRSGIERQVKQSRIVRTFCGRPRRFLGIAHDGRVTPKVVREALDYPMQAAVSDIFNLTVVAISEKYDFMTLLWGMHDSQYWELPRERYAKQLMAELHDIVEREWDVKGYPIRFPADFKVTAPPGEVVPDVA